MSDLIFAGIGATITVQDAIESISIQGNDVAEVFNILSEKHGFTYDDFINMDEVSVAKLKRRLKIEKILEDE